MLTKLSDNLLKLEHHADFKKLSWWITKTRRSEYNFALTVVLTKKSEMNLNDKGVFPQVCIDVF